MSDAMSKEVFLNGLAWDCVAAGQKPPLHPTTCAIIRIVGLLGQCRFASLLEIVPCSAEALRQQVSRLVRANVLEKRSVVDADGGRHSLYSLSTAGVVMVLTWREEHAKVMEKLRSLER